VILTDKHREFLARARVAAMITLRPDGTAHAVRVGVALIDGKLWSSGTETRLRTRHVRRDPRCTFIVFDEGFGFLSLEGTVTIRDGPEAPELNMRLFRVMQSLRRPAPASGNLMWYGKELTPDQFREAMIRERRVVYELEIARAYGPVT